jgi:hypothetical protein
MQIGCLVPFLLERHIGKVGRLRQTTPDPAGTTAITAVSGSVAPRTFMEITIDPSAATSIIAGVVRPTNYQLVRKPPRVVV